MEQEQTQNTPANEPAYNAEAGEQKNINNPLPNNFTIPLVAVLIIIVVAFAIYLFSRSQELEYTQENVSVVRADLNELEGENRIPAGFPTNTPVDVVNISESTSVHYADSGVVLHSVSYTSEEENLEVYTEWLEYMESEGYEIPETGRNIEQWMLYGTKDGDEMTIIINSGDNTLVQVNYLDK